MGEARAGETVTEWSRAADPLPGYREPKPMVFCGLYPIDGDEFPALREALERLRLNDSSFTFEPESSGALGFGFRCGFLGLLHMEIIRERLEREFTLSLIATAPSVEYRVIGTGGVELVIDNPSELPPAGEIEAIEEPFLTVTILTPTEYTGTVMDLCQTRRGEMQKLEYLSPERVELVYRVPLAEVVVDFFDQLKGRTQGYASLDYEPAGADRSDLVKVDILLNSVPVDAFSTIMHRDKAYEYGRRMVEKLRELIPRQLFDVPIQAGDRRPDHRPGDREGQAQGRAGQVLRRRHHPEAQAPGAPEGRQASDEEHRTGRSAPRSLHLRPPPGGLVRRNAAERSGAAAPDRPGSASRACVCRPSSGAEQRYPIDQDRRSRVCASRLRSERSSGTRSTRIGEAGSAPAGRAAERSSGTRSTRIGEAGSASAGRAVAEQRHPIDQDRRSRVCAAGQAVDTSGTR